MALEMVKTADFEELDGLPNFNDMSLLLSTKVTKL